MSDITEMTADMMGDLPPYCFSALVAARKSGKSHMLSHLIHSICKKKKYAAAFVISKTSKAQGSFKFIAPENHFNPLESDITTDEFLTKIMKMQRDRLDNGLPCGEILLLLDDLFHNSRSGAGHSSKALSALASIGRHAKISVFMCVQRFQSISPSLRSQLTDYLCFLPRSTGERAMITEQFLSREMRSRKESKTRATEIMSAVFSQPYRCMWVRPDVQSSLLKDCVFWCIAPPEIVKWSMQYDIISDTVSKATDTSSGPLSVLETA